MKTVTVKAGREKSLQRRHPWLFSGAIQKADKAIAAGETVKVVSASGEPLALGAWSPHSQIRVRIWSYNPDEIIDAGYFQRRIQNALALRRWAVPDTDNAWRLVNAESDGLPGVTIDRYHDYLVGQFLSAGAEYWKADIVGQLQTLLSPKGIYERSDVEVREREGLKPRSGLLAGEEPPELIEIGLDGWTLLVDVRKGHKTGAYLDQSRNSRRVRHYARDRDVLNCFSYSGGFTLAALAGGAGNVTNVEASAEVLALADRNLAVNRLAAERVENVQGDAFEVLRRFRDGRRRFDMVILDPPKFVSSAQQLRRGCRGYKDINLLAMKLLTDNGILVTFSCSGHVSPELFQKIVADAAQDAGREARILEFLAQSPDHPVALPFPEGRYLKGLICMVSGRE